MQPDGNQIKLTLSLPKRDRVRGGQNRDLAILPAPVIPAEQFERQQRVVNAREAGLAVQHRQNLHDDRNQRRYNNPNNNSHHQLEEPNEPQHRVRRALLARLARAVNGVAQDRPQFPFELLGPPLGDPRELLPEPPLPLQPLGAAGNVAPGGVGAPIALRGQPGLFAKAMDRAPYLNQAFPPYIARLIAVGDVSGLKIAVGEDNLVSYIPERPAGTAVYRFHETLMPGGRCYFEVEVVNMVKGGQIVIGLMAYETSQRLATAGPVGSTKNSIGLNLNGGLLLQSSSAPSHFGPRCHNRDVIGIGMHFAQRGVSELTNNVSVFFTHNGKEFGARNVVLFGQRFVPAVSLNQPGERVRFKFDATWPPQPRDDSEEMQCDHFDDLWDRLNDVRLNGDIIEYAGSGICNNDVGFAQATQPLTPSQHYFELEILDPGESCYIAIGVAHRQYPCKQHPGWSKGSIAYHADDGEVFVENGTGEWRAPMCGRGDRMGCGILFPSNLEEARFSIEECAAAAAAPSAAAGSGPVEARDGGRGGADNPGVRCRAVVHDSRLVIQCRRRGDNQRYHIHRQLQPPANAGGNPAGVELWSQSRVEIEDYVPHEQLDCGVRVKVFFTRNGQIICTKEMALPQEGFFPTVGLLSRGERIRVDLQPLSG